MARPNRSLVALALLIAPVIGAQADFYGTIGVGAARYFESAPGGPAWEQRGVDHHTEYGTPVWRLGLGYEFKRELRGEVSYDDLGRFDKFGGWRCADDGTNCGPTIYGYSEARTRTVTLSGIFGETVFGRIGAAVWHSTCDVFFSNPNPDNRALNRYTCTQTRGVSPIFGVGFRFTPDWSLEVDRYTVIKPHNGSTQGLNVLMLNRRF